MVQIFFSGAPIVVPIVLFSSFEFHEVRLS